MYVHSSFLIKIRAQIESNFLASELLKRCDVLYVYVFLPPLRAQSGGQLPNPRLVPRDLDLVVTLTNTNTNTNTTSAFFCRTSNLERRE